MLFIIAEGFRNLLRAKFTGFLSIISMIFALFLVSITAVIFQTMRVNIASVKNTTTMWVYFPTNIPSEKAKSFKADILKIDAIQQARFINRNEGLKELQEKSNNSSQTNLSIQKLLTYNPLPDSYVLTVKSTQLNTNKIVSIKKELLKLQRGLDIRIKSEQVEQIQSIARSITKILSSLAIFIGIITIILVYNTIRLSIHSKKDAIQTMQLVGARNSFIRRPFIIESLLQSIIALVIVLTLTNQIVDILNNSTLISNMLPREVQMHRYHNYIIIGLAFFMSYFGAVLSVRKYLKPSN
jgi:cell division transport system permease protein